MKTVLRLTAIFNFLLVLTALLSAVIAAFTKDVRLLAVSVALMLSSIFPTAMSFALNNEVKDK